MVEKIIKVMIQKNCSRKTRLVTIGGGTLGDTGGLVASLFMRGIDWHYYPTTILSQVDSCIGGKVGVNHKLGKNLLGHFYHPKKVFIREEFLKTLPEKEVLSGLGEIYKYALLNPLSFDLEKVKIERQLIYLCLKEKVFWMEGDEFDKKGRREKLNIGHTLGHALEKSLNYDISHGEAVWWGLLFESTLGKEEKLNKNLLSYKPLKEKDVLLLKSEELREFIKVDKKGSFHFFDDKQNKIILTEKKFDDFWINFKKQIKEERNGQDNFNGN